MKKIVVVIVVAVFALTLCEGHKTFTMRPATKPKLAVTGISSNLFRVKAYITTPLSAPSTSGKSEYNESSMTLIPTNTRGEKKNPEPGSKANGGGVNSSSQGVPNQAEDFLKNVIIFALLGKQGPWLQLLAFAVCVVILIFWIINKQRERGSVQSPAPDPAMIELRLLEEDGSV